MKQSRGTWVEIEGPDIDLFLDRFLAIALFMVSLGLVFHVVNALLQLASPSDSLFFLLDLVLVLLLGTAFLLRRRLPRAARTTILAVAAGSLAVLSFYYNGLIGNGAVLVCTFIFISVLFLRRRGGALAALIGFLLFPLFGVLVGFDAIVYDADLIERLNSPRS